MRRSVDTMIRELKRAPWWAKGILGIVGLFVVLAIVGTAIGEEESRDAPQSIVKEVRATPTHEPTEAPKQPTVTPQSPSRLETQTGKDLGRNLYIAIFERDFDTVDVQCDKIVELLGDSSDIDDLQDHDRLVDPCNDVRVRMQWDKALAEARDLVGTFVANDEEARSKSRALAQQTAEALIPTVEAIQTANAR